MEHRVYHGHHGLTKVHANSTLLREMGLVIEDDVAIQMTQIILILVMTTKQLLITMLLVAHQENVSMFNAIVIQKVHHLVLQ